MNEISWLILLLFLPFCLNMTVSILEGISNILPRKPQIVVHESVRYKERVVYKDRPIPNDLQNNDLNTNSPTVSPSLISEVVASLLSLGVTKKNATTLTNRLCSEKKYLDSESLMEDCLKSL